MAGAEQRVGAFLEANDLTFVGARSLAEITARLLAAAADPATAQANPPAAESRVWFTGASNLRPFTCRAGDVYATLELAPGRTVALGAEWARFIEVEPGGPSLRRRAPARRRPWRRP